MLFGKKRDTQGSTKSAPRKHTYSPHNSHTVSPENQWLEDDISIFKWSCFLGGRVRSFSGGGGGVTVTPKKQSGGWRLEIFFWDLLSSRSYHLRFFWSVQVHFPFTVPQRYPKTYPSKNGGIVMCMGLRLSWSCCRKTTQTYVAFQLKLKDNSPSHLPVIIWTSLTVP